MADASDRRSPLAGFCEPGKGASGTAAVALAERGPLTLLILHADPQARRVVNALKRAIGTALPRPAGAVASAGGTTILCLGPDRLLAIAPHDADGLAPAFAAAGAAVTDVSHGYKGMRVAGPAAREVLSALSPLDLRPRSLAADRCAQTGLRTVPAILHLRADGESFDLYVMRSYAASVWDWLADAASPFGYRIDPPVA